MNVTKIVLALALCVGMPQIAHSQTARAEVDSTGGVSTVTLPNGNVQVTTCTTTDYNMSCDTEELTPQELLSRNARQQKHYDRAVQSVELMKALQVDDPLDWSGDQTEILKCMREYEHNSDLVQVPECKAAYNKAVTAWNAQNPTKQAMQTL